MEPRGCNSWQSAANDQKPKTVAEVCDHLPESFHGKEGVDFLAPQREVESPRNRRPAGLDPKLTDCKAPMPLAASRRPRTRPAGRLSRVRVSRPRRRAALP